MNIINLISKPLPLPTHPFWEFSQEIYAKQDVKLVCLDWQERYQMNVNVLLFLLWLAQTGRGRVHKAELLGYLSHINNWHVRITQNCRKLRVLLGSKKMISAEQQSLYTLALEEEIAAEQVEQLLLLDAMILPSKQGRLIWQRAAEMLDSFKIYAGILTVKLQASDYRALVPLLMAAFPQLTVANIEQLCGLTA